MPTLDVLFFFNAVFDLCVHETLDNQKIINMA